MLMATLQGAFGAILPSSGHFAHGQPRQPVPPQWAPSGTVHHPSFASVPGHFISLSYARLSISSTSGPKTCHWFPSIQFICSQWLEAIKCRERKKKSMYCQMRLKVSGWGPFILPLRLQNEHTWKINTDHESVVVVLLIRACFWQAKYINVF